MCTLYYRCLRLFFCIKAHQTTYDCFDSYMGYSIRIDHWRHTEWAAWDGPNRTEAGCTRIFLFDQIWEAHINKDDSHDDDTQVSDDGPEEGSQHFCLLLIACFI